MTTTKELNTVRVLVALQKAKVQSTQRLLAANSSIEAKSQTSAAANRTYTRDEVKKLMLSEQSDITTSSSSESAGWSSVISSSRRACMLY